MHHLSLSAESTVGQLKGRVCLVVGLNKECIRLFAHGIPLIDDASRLSEYGIVTSRMNEIRVVESPNVGSVMLFLDHDDIVTPVFVAPTASIAEVIQAYERSRPVKNVSGLACRGLVLDIQHGTVSSHNLLTLDVLQVTVRGTLPRKVNMPRKRPDYTNRKLADCFPRDLAGMVIDPPGDGRCGYWSLLCGMLKVVSDHDADKIPLAHLLAFKSALVTRISAISLDLTDEAHNMDGNLVRSGLPWSHLLCSVVFWYIESGTALESMCSYDPVWKKLYEQVRHLRNVAAAKHGQDPSHWIEKPVIKELVRVCMQGIAHALLEVDCGFAVDDNMLEHAQFGQGLLPLVALCGCFQSVAVVPCVHRFDTEHLSIGYTFSEPHDFRCSSVSTRLPSCVLFHIEQKHPTHIAGRHYLVVSPDAISRIDHGRTVAHLDWSGLQSYFESHSLTVRRWDAAHNPGRADASSSEPQHEDDLQAAIRLSLKDMAATSTLSAIAPACDEILLSSNATGSQSSHSVVSSLSTGAPAVVSHVGQIMVDDSVSTNPRQSQTYVRH